MRFGSNIALLILFICFQHCDVPGTGSSALEKAPSLRGRWKQKVNFFSIGDATIHRQPLADTSYQYLQLNDDSTMQTNISMLTAYGKYSVLSDSVIRFSGINIQPVTNQYKMAGDTLHLYMQCIEPCGGSFVREDR